MICAVGLAFSLKMPAFSYLGGRGREDGCQAQGSLQPVPHSETFSKDKTHGGFVYMANPFSGIFQKYPEK